MYLEQEIDKLQGLLIDWYEREKKLMEIKNELQHLKKQEEGSVIEIDPEEIKDHLKAKVILDNFIMEKALIKKDITEILVKTAKLIDNLDVEIKRLFSEKTPVYTLKDGTKLVLKLKFDSIDDYYRLEKLNIEKIPF